MAESSLFFNGVGFCPSVSGYHDKLTNLHHLVKPQEGVERRLYDGTDRQCKEYERRRKTLSKVCDLAIDRLLL
jgi:hypothetical protein